MIYRRANISLILLFAIFALLVGSADANWWTRDDVLELYSVDAIVTPQPERNYDSYLAHQILNEENFLIKGHFNQRAIRIDSQVTNEHKLTPITDGEATVLGRIENPIRPQFLVPMDVLQENPYIFSLPGEPTSGQIFKVNLPLVDSGEHSSSQQLPEGYKVTISVLANPNSEYQEAGPSVIVRVPRRKACKLIGKVRDWLH